MNTKFTALTLICVTLMATIGCKKDNVDTTPKYDVPTTYNFANADFSESTTRIGMITEMQNVMKTALTGPLDGQKLKDMFTNTNAPFTTAAYNTSGIQIKDQGATQYQADMLTAIDSLVAASKSGVPASRGVAGVGVSSANAASKYALSAAGINYAQVVSKGTMGGFLAYQIVNNYMAAALNNSLDNNVVVPGKGTAAEHNWDLAFGYWGVPIDFPTNKTGAKLWGSYSTQVDSGFHANKILMDAFLKGRAAISNKDVKTMKEQATIITLTFEKLMGAAVLQEVKEIKASLNDNMVRNSRVSEGYAFLNSIKYLPKKTATDAQINTMLALFPANFYDLTLDQVNQIRDAVAKQYGFEDVKDIL